MILRMVMIEAWDLRSLLVSQVMTSSAFYAIAQPKVRQSPTPCDLLLN